MNKVYTSKDKSYIFPDGIETVLCSFSSKAVKTGFATVNKSNRFILSVSGLPYTSNVDYKNKSPNIKISNLTKDYVNGLLSNATDLETPSILAYEFVINNDLIENQYRKTFLFTRASSITAYIDSIPDNVIVVMFLSGDSSKISEADFKTVFTDKLKSNFYRANPDYQIRQNWLGVYSGGNSKTGLAKKLVFEDYKNTSTSYNPKKDPNTELNLKFAFNSMESLYGSKISEEYLTTLTKYGFNVSSINEVKIPDDETVMNLGSGSINFKDIMEQDSK